MTLHVRLSMDNAAFDPDSQGTEAARILRKLADQIDGQSWVEADLTSDDSFQLMDANGNTVGRADVTE